jgi:hypothetical protein
VKGSLLIKNYLASCFNVTSTSGESLDALIKCAKLKVLSHIQRISEELLLIELLLRKHNFYLDEEFLTEIVALGTVETKVDLSYFKASTSVSQRCLEMLSDLNWNL